MNRGSNTEQISISRKKKKKKKNAYVAADASTLCQVISACRPLTKQSDAQIPFLQPGRKTGS